MSCRADADEDVAQRCREMLRARADQRRRRGKDGTAGVPRHKDVTDVPLTAGRTHLRRRFVSGAKEMCFALWTAGYWADFIDPTTGEAFFASPSSQTKLRTEEELRDLGFHIEVSGSCTVIRHILRGTSLFVGTVFTNAPAHSAAIARLQGL
ncbi:hypothetical protein JOQ06_000574 [Pogonophryne albipinna]|uniref:Uncharacterized protein n=1 Tax=Pogonophryne albipinna TaxID=1090488 RepID=A0AAD6AFI4_9TELE|nr:hypothetical protein JOQ06_000574 [Pogonophryne albipinna]